MQAEQTLQGAKVAVVTGASRGLGAALAEGLARVGWSLVIDGRDPDALAGEVRSLRAVHDGRAPVPRGGRGAPADRGRASSKEAAVVTAVAGDVADPNHRAALAQAAGDLGRVDLVVNNASILGPSPQPLLVDYPLDALRAVYEVNALAPLALLQELEPLLRAAPDPRVVAVTSDAAVEPYPGWGGYGSSKAALERLTAIWAAEQPWCRSWAVDPGDLRTRLHQEAFPGEDISDRPLPGQVVPALMALIDSDRPSGRVRLADVAVAGAVG